MKTATKSSIILKDETRDMYWKTTINNNKGTFHNEHEAPTATSPGIQGDNYEITICAPAAAFNGNDSKTTTIPSII